ncbi:MAG: LON peptidase substrate-binding domain-containing protein [Alphaproteobacteria bacterium]|nr:LON peptidase substrate-binding domain-containing protein [Alphaproteobacteria bacterium]
MNDLGARLHALPVFPLPGAVLMPSSVLPLHVFEPRYRELLKAVLASDGLMGIATLDRAASDADDAPPIHPEIGVGKVVQSETLPDGRSNVVLLHVGSARAVRELHVDTPYRVFATQPIAEDEPAEAALAGVRAMVLQLGAATPSAGPEAQRLAAVPGMDLVHSLARRMFQSSDEQRAYLGCDTPGRIRLVSDGLATLLASTGAIGDA